MKLLKLTLKKVWFNKIISGEKRIEYREYKEYWRTRLLNLDEPYTHVVFKNGYQVDSPITPIYKILGVQPESGYKTALKCPRVIAIYFESEDL